MLSSAEFAFTPNEHTAALTLDQAINLCLMNDPKIRAGLEAINQAHADALTASLRPNPEMTVGGTLLPLSRPITPQQPGGPSEFDWEVAIPSTGSCSASELRQWPVRRWEFASRRPIMPTSCGSE